jgi:hypothetical protein
MILEAGEVTCGCGVSIPRAFFLVASYSCPDPLRDFPRPSDTDNIMDAGTHPEDPTKETDSL